MSQLYLQEIERSHEISPEELHVLLLARAKGRVSFWLIDVREKNEYTASSIKGTDGVFPTSTLHTQLNAIFKLQDRLVIFYCTNARRTFRLIPRLKRMGFTKIAHLSGGIIEYGGEKLKNAPLPSSINHKETL
ncbi:MAG: rhodanese-like domain-containing protein [Epsilonproteobacteria bacterium]|uniref:rhodanese-like domain-containing protein n=1 Tax=Sulfurospirillum TaxID=57665 RepID=UPI0005437B83|nr:MULTISPECIES: rhodanese-like domain-containing protein [Sulfurospirillum]KHG33653.1 MAG: sulfurtransferase [Sulfurospirillum sp. MES]MCD8544744.1 rhodanese-like domain-containing protein [Sulfurospirillum cavolei]NCB54362.1 rhodanese-like domain-containing protein [Campylobacterota bacterium]